MKELLRPRFTDDVRSGSIRRRDSSRSISCDGPITVLLDGGPLLYGLSDFCRYGLPLPSLFLLVDSLKLSVGLVTLRLLALLTKA